MQPEKLICTETPVPFWGLSLMYFRVQPLLSVRRGWKLIPTNMLTLPVLFSFFLWENFKHIQKEKSTTNVRGPTTRFQELIFCHSYFIYSHPKVPFWDYYKANPRHCAIHHRSLEFFVCPLLCLMMQWLWEPGKISCWLFYLDASGMTHTGI